MIEFSEASGLIKCSQNPQLFFHMSEVIEKKKLELNEKVEFSVVPVSLYIYYNNRDIICASLACGHKQVRITFIFIVLLQLVVERLHEVIQIWLKLFHIQISKV